MVGFRVALELIRRDGSRARRPVWPIGRFVDWPHPDCLSVVRKITPAIIDSSINPNDPGATNLAWYMPHLRIMGPPPGPGTPGTVNPLTLADYAATDWVVLAFPNPRGHLSPEVTPEVVHGTQGYRGGLGQLTDS